METTTANRPQGRQMQCGCCGHTRPRKGSKKITGTGFVCEPCVAVLSEDRAIAAQLAPAPKSRAVVQAPAAPRHRSTARPRPTITAPWTARQADKPATAPAQAAGHADMPPGVKVTIRPTPRGRFEVDPAAVTPLFSALGLGRYLDKGTA